MVDEVIENRISNKQFNRWKTLIPFLYDWFNHHNLTPWPSYSCRWGPLVEPHTHKTTQRLYLSERTDGTANNTLLVMNAEVIKPRVAAAEHISKFNEEMLSPFVKKIKIIPHPGEVNRIRECPQHPHIVVTHTDAPELYVWNVITQPSDPKDKETMADLILVGHKETASFALGMSHKSPCAASGGEDKMVLVWSLEDHMSTLSATAPQTASRRSATSILPRHKFVGHKNTIEDVKFNPASEFELCSVGDDKALLFWDSRAGSDPVMKVLKAHSGDLHCVDWSPFEENQILTGSADRFLKLFDRRKASEGALHVFASHQAPITTVEWSPHTKGVFGSASEDTRVNIWDCSKLGARQTSEDKKSGPPELMFQHAGHRAQVVDFHWNPLDPWTCLSVSDDSSESSGSGGGTLQLWRVNDLIYRPEKEVLAELEQHREALLGRKVGAQGGAGASKPAATLVLPKPVKLSSPTKVAKTTKEGSVKEEAAASHSVETKGPAKEPTKENVEQVLLKTEKVPALEEPTATNIKPSESQEKVKGDTETKSKYETNGADVDMADNIYYTGVEGVEGVSEGRNKEESEKNETGEVAKSNSIAKELDTKKTSETETPPVQVAAAPVVAIPFFPEEEMADD
mmetsp:Transcript_32664/g.45343  ORF Transcript_32664/g.45343 Transcript_32664/m.45343 type:complete len:628 (+) Transcript_32664:100-1983(+)|eukprot:CAMPEP_0196580444 /NCGR_PEP_ID=MMETSP1081-20130531/28630_1 /TAXON_ID=36882 /ORGANISM="Pyramimonas amylifera, Strain CCMP720" /LENGTH=627 /DNA_ID=CAMNT_0041900307 /DNA_START=90 /DNA_END=1973 /DNA_ORIENTATION=+